MINRVRVTFLTEKSGQERLGDLLIVTHPEKCRTKSQVKVLQLLVTPLNFWVNSIHIWVFGPELLSLMTWQKVPIPVYHLLDFCSSWKIRVKRGERWGSKEFHSSNDPLLPASYFVDKKVMTLPMSWWVIDVNKHCAFHKTHYILTDSRKVTYYYYYS
jgi:hypothetical protein